LEAREVLRGDLTLVECEDCGFVFNETFDDSLLSYGARYNNSQMASPSFDKYVDSIVEHLDLETQVVCEIGCGNGAFLKKLGAAGITGVGYDPSCKPYQDGITMLVPGYYDGLWCDIIVCRHVIEHVADPLALIRSCNAPRVFFETPNFDWIVENNSWWDFFYEHCNYFSAESLCRAFESQNYTAHVAEAFEGQYIWLDGYLGSGGEGRDLLRCS
jgi:2-polyprenyl-3-methyl-5-hydroxy-6-metoxy-1,4-benzoquinol methylase